MENKIKDATTINSELVTGERERESDPQEILLPLIPQDQHFCVPVVMTVPSRWLVR
jgi:hypothetical protein